MGMWWRRRRWMYRPAGGRRWCLKAWMFRMARAGARCGSTARTSFPMMMRAGFRSSARTRSEFSLCIRGTIRGRHFTLARRWLRRRQGFVCVGSRLRRSRRSDIDPSKYAFVVLSGCTVGAVDSGEFAGCRNVEDGRECADGGGNGGVASVRTRRHCRSGAGMYLRTGISIRGASESAGEGVFDGEG